ncbi:MAG: P-loop NTPase fold protein [Candidatus Neomarinimicrobiota bacterium]
MEKQAQSKRQPRKHEYLVEVMEHLNALEWIPIISRHIFRVLPFNDRERYISAPKLLNDIFSLFALGHLSAIYTTNKIPRQRILEKMDTLAPFKSIIMSDVQESILSLVQHLKSTSKAIYDSSYENEDDSNIIARDLIDNILLARNISEGQYTIPLADLLVAALIVDLEQVSMPPSNMDRIFGIFHRSPLWPQTLRKVIGKEVGAWRKWVNQSNLSPLVYQHYGDIYRGKTNWDRLLKDLLEGVPRVEESAALHGRADTVLPDPSQDKLGLIDFAEALSVFIKNPNTGTPFSLAINAPWGAGKSTVAGWIRQHLEDPDLMDGVPAATVWFNAWHHDDAENLATVFAAEVAREGNKHRKLWRKLFMPLDINLLPGSRRKWWIIAQFGAAGLMLAIVAYNLIKGMSLTDMLIFLERAFDIEVSEGGGAFAPVLFLLALITTYWPRFFSLAKSVGDFVNNPRKMVGRDSMAVVSEQIGTLIKQATWRGNRFIIFVDDLERCRPPKAVEVLETAMQLFCHDNVIIVFTADMAVVAAHIDIKYEKLARRHDEGTLSLDGTSGMSYGEAFLQKLIQLQFDLPSHARSKIEKMIGAEEDDSEGDGDEVTEELPPIRQFLQNTLSAVATAAIGLFDGLLGALNGFADHDRIRNKLKKPPTKKWWSSLLYRILLVISFLVQWGRRWLVFPLFKRKNVLRHAGENWRHWFSYISIAICLMAYITGLIPIIVATGIPQSIWDTLGGLVQYFQELFDGQQASSPAASGEELSAQPQIVKDSTPLVSPVQLGGSLIVLASSTALLLIHGVIEGWRFERRRKNNLATVNEAISGSTLDEDKSKSMEEKGISKDFVESKFLEKRVYSHLNDSDVLTKVAGKAIKFLPPLPRNVKRLVNRIRVLHYLAEKRGVYKEGTGITEFHVGKLAILREKWPGIAHVIMMKPVLMGKLESAAKKSEDDFNQLILSQFKQTGTENSDLREFCTQPPMLAGEIKDLLSFSFTESRSESPDTASS